MKKPASEKPLLQGQEVAFTGRLASLTRKEAAGLVTDLGGVFVSSPGRRTTLLVMGQEGWPLREDGRLTRKLERARALQDSGQSISIIPEEEFLERISLSERRENIHRLYTITQLTRILEVPRDRVRLWMRTGLIRPVRMVHHLAYFDFHQVAAARMLCRLTGAGVTAGRIRKSLLALKAWSPGVERSLWQLSLLERQGRILVRLENGQLAEPSGQLLFDFMAEEEPQEPERPPLRVDLNPRTAEGWFELALRREDEGELEEAAEAYRRALLLAGPQAELCFNLANVLYELDRKDQAVERFYQALELEPEYVEAWNNLGNALGDLGEQEKAIEAYRRALKVEPGYADAHYNLAETLRQAGREGEARIHWKAYLKQDPGSVWAENVRQQLANRVLP